MINQRENDQIKEELHEECGVFGAYNVRGEDIASWVYYGLFALQHRGQESCGIAVSENRDIRYYKDMGLVNEVFTPENLDKVHGDIAIGHVRYSTAGSSVRANAQPLVTKYVKGQLAIAHNGNLVNAVDLREELEQQGAIFQTTIDSEVIAYLVAKERVHCGSVEEAVARAMPYIKGAYSLLVMSPRKLIAARDPHGFKPLCIGKREDTWVVASETCALDTVGAEFIRDVEPGEIIVINEEGLTSDRRYCHLTKKCSRCVFEYIYFARPDSVIDGVSVFNSRIMAGRILAQTHPVEADLVVGVPESGNDAAMGYALESGIPYGRAFVKNNYVGRTFIKPKQSMREQSVKIKLNVLKDAVKGKRIVMIDDSIVRGTTSGNIVQMLKNAGATEVHVRISSPPFKYPCYFGTDIPNRDQLIANHHTIEEIGELMGADSLGYLDLDRMGEMVEGLDYCEACFNGNYPIEPPTRDIRGDMEF
ncbi:MAG: amidophosphoribosyltransferase [Frisingicoccus sp.]|uniref:amidophosphoribosyltransferase n=1 Tax=Frisingicoccus sp. TaxID=1918627 RepID=UPI0025B989E8|nr:amidophosphoribosyltransferase [Frisingicoccus sp.]MDD6233058.1 amidophosphoribosyltransferase [Frisingicoccus sp.]MDY4834777.1 amidophosphoribosyltransferase [Frisingicoccus sp.]